MSAPPSPHIPTHCPQCGREMVFSDRRCDDTDPQRASRGHILPRARGGEFIMHLDTRNSRWMCAACNGLVAGAYHCVGALACARDVARDLSRTDPSVTTRTVMNQWGFGKLVNDLHRRDAEAAREAKRQSLDRALDAIHSAFLATGTFPFAPLLALR